MNSPSPAALDGQAREVFLRAAELTSPDARDAFIEGACRDNPALLARVYELLRAQPPASFLEGAACEDAAPTCSYSAPVEETGASIGRYKLLERLGEGGFGVVWLAEQKEPVRRKVALKIIKLGMDTRQVVARFEAERQALALMDHPNIARILDAGVTGSPLPSSDEGRGAGGEGAGRPYFVMELVRGIRITDYCDQAHLNTNDRLDLFIKVCHAIQHAHQKGIIHRDIKPSNILVTLHDGVPVPKVIDFGIAKATQVELTDKTIHTLFQQFIGTPAYMSPEQAEMSGLDIDTRSDIYALGVLLYELLVGRTPFDGKELWAAGIDAMRKTIREKEPVRPSTKLATLQVEELSTTAKSRSSEAPKLIHLLRGDLDWIVMKCLEKDRARRYDTANGLAADLKRHLSNEPVVARPPSATYKLQKAWRRNRLVFTAAGAVAASLMVGLCVSTVLFLKESKARQEARTAASEQSRLRQLADEQRQIADTSAETLRNNLYASEMSQAFAAFRAGSIQRARDLLEQQSNFAKAGGGGFEWRWLWGQTRPAEQAILRLPEFSLISDIDFSRDGSRFLISGAGPLEVRDTVSRELVISNQHAFSYHSEFSRDGKFILSTDNGGQIAKLWDASTGEFLTNFVGHTANVPYGTISPDGRLLATSAMWPYSKADGEVFLWDMESRQRVAVLEEPGSQFIFGGQFSPDNRILATGCGNGQILLWELATLRIAGRLSGHRGAVMGIRFTPDGKRLVSAGLDRTVRLWDVGEKREISLLGLHEKSVARIAISPDGRLAASAGFDHMLMLWTLDPPGLFHTLRGHEARVWGAAFHPNGRMLATAGGDGTVRFWKVPQVPDEWALENVAAWNFGFATKNRLLLGLARDQHIDVWDVTSRKQIAHVPGEHPWWVPDSEHIVFIRGAQLIELDVPRGSEGILGIAGESEEGLKGTRISLDGRLVAWNHKDHVHVFDRTSRVEVARLETGEGGDLAFSNNGTLLAIAVGNAIQLWDTATWRRTRLLEGHQGGIKTIRFSPRSLELASSSSDRTVRLWRLTTGEQWMLRGDEGESNALAYSPDGLTLAVATFEGSVKLWSVATRQQIASFVAGVSYVDSLNFSPDGTALASTSYDQKVHVWQAPTWEKIAKAEAKQGQKP